MSVSNIDRLRVQREAHRVLGGLLHVDSLPTIAWTIATTGAITGQVDGLGSTPDMQRAVFHAWAAHLDADLSRRTDRDGTVHLTARFKSGNVVGAVRAVIAPPLGGDR